MFNHYRQEKINDSFEWAVIERYRPVQPHPLQPIADFMLAALRGEVPLPGVFTEEPLYDPRNNPDGLFIADTIMGPTLIVIEAKTNKNNLSTRQTTRIPYYLNTLLWELSNDMDSVRSLPSGFSIYDVNSIYYDPFNYRQQRIVLKNVTRNLVFTMESKGIHAKHRVGGSYGSSAFPWAIDLLSVEHPLNKQLYVPSSDRTLASEDNFISFFQDDFRPIDSNP